LKKFISVGSTSDAFSIQLLQLAKQTQSLKYQPMFSLLKKPIRAKKPVPNQVSQRHVEVAGRQVPITVTENRRATRITLRIEPGGRALKLTIPYGLHHQRVDEFLERHQGWLEQRFSKISAPNHLSDGAMLPVRGVPHRIKHTGKLRGLTKLDRDETGAPIISVSGLPELTAKKLLRFLKDEARADLERLVAYHASFVKKPVKSITLKDTRSRWGSCSHEGNLSFSWRIVMAPESVIDYLAAHEVAHLDQMNHGPNFWALCHRLCPHTEEAKAWLKTHGSSLHAIDFS
jgi:predicted metal-dependent hydrolase